MTRSERREMRAGILFISPWLIGMGMFLAYPVLASVYYSFCEYSVLDKARPVGLANYADLMGDRLFWKSLFNTVYFAALSIPLGLVLALGLLDSNIMEIGPCKDHREIPRFLFSDLPSLPRVGIESCDSYARIVFTRYQSPSLHHLTKSLKYNIGR